MIKPDYLLEKVEAYNLAIECLRNHEPASDEVNPKEAKRLRLALADKLDSECNRWLRKIKTKQP
jgi:hypothetical protein